MMKLSLSQAQKLYSAKQYESVFLKDLELFSYVGFLGGFKKRKVKQLMIYVAKVKSLNNGYGYEFTVHLYDCLEDRIYSTECMRYDSFLVFKHENKNC